MAVIKKPTSMLGLSQFKPLSVSGTQQAVSSGAAFGNELAKAGKTIARITTLTALHQHCQVCKRQESDHSRQGRSTYV